MKIQNLDSLKSITWSELGKQNIQAKKVHYTLCSYIAVIHMVKNYNTGEEREHWDKTTKEITNEIMI